MAPSQRFFLAVRVRPLAIASLLVLVVGLWVPSGPVLAHRLQVFASAVADQIQGRVYFVGGHPARDVEVRVLDDAGRPVAEVTTDDEGRFRTRVPAVADYRVVAQSGDGHRAEWPVSAAELIGVLDAEPTSLDEPLPDGRSAVQSAGRSSASVEPERGSEDAVTQAPRQPLALSLTPELERAIEQAVARQVLPLREALAEAQAQASFRDLLGGLGYIAGLAGLGFWWTQRRRQQRDSHAGSRDG